MLNKISTLQECNATKMIWLQKPVQNIPSVIYPYALHTLWLIIFGLKN